ncbi:MAG: tyrosine-type recombinase/integrase [Christensenellales bacterium]|jgi:integrase/recombinase XerC
MKTNYYLERNKKNIQQISKYLENLPSFVFDFFVGVENQTTTLTRANYAMDLRIFFEYLNNYKFFCGTENITLSQLDSLTATDIESYLSYLSFYEFNGKVYHNTERGKARKLSSLRSFFKYFFNKEKLSKNIISKIPTPKQHQKEILRMEVDEVAKMLNFAEDASFATSHQTSYNKNTAKRDFAILSLFLGTGIRVSELVGLNIEDIDFNSNAFKIVRKGGNQVVLYFGDEVKDALLAYMEERLEQKIDTNALFLSLQKQRITTRAVQNLVKKYAKEVSPLKKISPHKLRSTYGTNLYRETQDIYIVADVLGHKDVNTTKKHYAAISEDLRKNAASKVKLR